MEEILVGEITMIIKKIILSDDNFKQLDFGLNSPWYINLKKFLNFKVKLI